MPKPLGRPSKNLPHSFNLRINDEERTLVKMVAAELDCSLNDAIRVCIRRGYADVSPSPVTDGPVLDPNYNPRDHYAPVTPVPGQAPLFSDAKETP